jgi:GNAT superfamily N-acetyltransferase
MGAAGERSGRASGRIGDSAVRLDFAVREATVRDLATVIELRLALLREYGDHPVYGRLRPDADDRARDLYPSQLSSLDQVILLAELDRDPVGILRCVDSIGSPLLYPQRYCYVSSVFVRPDYRRMGVLNALLDAASAWSRRRGLNEMRLHNSSTNADAVAAWDALGFEVVEQVRVRTLSAER